MFIPFKSCPYCGSISYYIKKEKISKYKHKYTLLCQTCGNETENISKGERIYIERNLKNNDLYHNN